MRTFFASLWYTARSPSGVGSPARRPARLLGHLADVRARVGAQDGFLLIEVLISTLLVGVMVIATYNGLDSINRSTAEQRRHDEAADLAIQSQEQLRSDSATTLLALPAAGHSYTFSVGGTQYTITQKASYGNGGTETGCNASEKGSTGKGTYILISSTVTWPHSKSIPVTESSIITPPTGSALKVTVTNGGSMPTAGVPITVTYTPVEGESATTIEATTGSSGCALFAGIPATSATVEAKETQGIVTRWGSLYLPPTTVTLAPNVLTPLPLTLAPGGRIEPKFLWNGASSYTHAGNGGLSSVTEEVKGDTFVAFNLYMKEAPYFETGSNQTPFTMSGNLFEILPDTAGGAYAAAKSTTPTEPIKYPQGNLFPFPSSEDTWTVYAGDCTSNNPKPVTEAAKTTVVTPPFTEVVANGSSSPAVSVPMTYVLLNLYQKNQAEFKKNESVAWKWLETAKSYPVTITNTKCAGVKPNDETALKTQHTQLTTTGSVWGGHLEAPFQPFGEYGLCLYAAGKTYTVKPYTNASATTPVTRNIYLEEVSNKEKQAAREASEAATQTAREASEAPGRKKREEEEAAEAKTKATEESAKATRLSTEATEKANWEYTISHNGKPTATKNSEKAAEEAKQATKRAAAVATEKLAEEKRKSEETITAGIKTTEITKRTAAEAAEAAAETAAIAAEAKEISEKEVTVESGKTSC
jgi:type II secretory pathway pseudopilin PulG